jgi:hypothetical protein
MCFLVYSNKMEHSALLHAVSSSTLSLIHTPTPCSIIAADCTPNFVILGNSAYLGEPTKTPGLHQIALQKHSLVQPDQHMAMQELKRLWVFVKCWFGHQQLLWGIIHRTYSWSKQHFDLDFDITALLTNEHIHISSLMVTD